MVREFQLSSSDLSTRYIHHLSHFNAWCYFCGRNKNGPRIVDHRFHNLTPNRREEDEVYFQRTTPRIPGNPNRNRFDSIGDDPGRYDSSSREPLARIAFGKLPYPAGNSELNRRTWMKINVILSNTLFVWTLFVAWLVLWGNASTFF